MTIWEDRLSALRASPRSWLVTGAAGFIGSNLVELLLSQKQRVVGLDNLSTGKQANLSPFIEDKNFRFIKGDIVDYPQCLEACAGVDYVLHQAALGSVPRSIEDPLSSHVSNVTGMLNMLKAAHASQVKRLVYASSSSVYGDLVESPKLEQRTGKLLSPYAATKKINEIYAGVFETCYGLSSVGLRYFNVFGPRQDPNGAYAAVIPRWIGSLLKGEECLVFGDGETSRDFCYVDNVVQANILSATVSSTTASASVYNIACAGSSSLNTLYREIQAALSKLSGRPFPEKASYKPFRDGDIRHSLADISRAQDELGYRVLVNFEEGVRKTVAWFFANA